MTSSVRKIKATRIGSAFGRTSVETYKQKQAPYRGENFGATGILSSKMKLLIPVDGNTDVSSDFCLDTGI